MNFLACALLLLGACDRPSRRRRHAVRRETARGYVKTQVDFGARVPGTAAAARLATGSSRQMRQRADTVIEQRGST